MGIIFRFFANLSFVIHIRTIFSRQQCYIFICGLINQFMHINQFTLWSQSMKCLSYLSSYNHTMQPSRRKCIYKRYDNFKVILNQFFYGGKRVVPDDIMEAIRDEIHDVTNILYNYTIPITIPILECILKRNELTMYKDSIYLIYFKLSGLQSRHITTKEYNMMLKVFDVVSTIYDKYKPKGRKSFLNYSFVLKQILIMRNMDQYAKYIPKLKTHSKQKELERLWFLITKDPEFAVALRKRKIS